MDKKIICADLPAESDDIINGIIENYSDMIFRLAISQLRNKADAEDVFQEVFVKYIKAEKTFENEDHIKAWLIRVTVNCCKKLRNTAWLRHVVPLEDWADGLADNDKAEKSEVYYAVLELPSKYRTIIYLFYYEDMQTDEISRVLKMKQSTVLSRLHRARNMLRKKLKGEYDYE